MSAIDILPPTGQLITKVEIQILPQNIDNFTDEGKGNHLEFCTEEVRMTILNEYHLPQGEKHRGVFGYVAFGLGGGQLPNGGTEYPRWMEGRFINWGRTLFYPQDGLHKENCRIWLRKKVKAHIHVFWTDPAQTSVQWRIPGS